MDLITLQDTTAVSLQYLLIGTFAAAFVELIKGPFKNFESHKHIIALISGLFGGVIECLMFGIDQSFFIEGFMIGLAASGVYRIVKK